MWQVYYIPFNGLHTISKCSKWQLSQCLNVMAIPVPWLSTYSTISLGLSGDSTLTLEWIFRSSNGPDLIRQSGSPWDHIVQQDTTKQQLDEGERFFGLSAVNVHFHFVEMSQICNRLCLCAGHTGKCVPPHLRYLTPTYSLAVLSIVFYLWFSFSLWFQDSSKGKSLMASRRLQWSTCKVLLPVSGCTLYTGPSPLRTMTRCTSFSQHACSFPGPPLSEKFLEKKTLIEVQHLLLLSHSTSCP